MYDEEDTSFFFLVNTIFSTRGHDLRRYNNWYHTTMLWWYVVCTMYGVHIRKVLWELLGTCTIIEKYVVKIIIQ
jgi:hypothetical protein